MKLFLEGLVVFAVTFACDVAWTKYFLAAAAKHPARAGLWSAMIVVLGGISFYSYLDSRWMLVPSILGAYLGTWWTVKNDADSHAG